MEINNYSQLQSFITQILLYQEDSNNLEETLEMLKSKVSNWETFDTKKTEKMIFDTRNVLISESCF